MNSGEKDLMAAFDRFRNAMGAAGGTPMAFTVQAVRNNDPFGSRGMFYRLTVELDGEKSQLGEAHVRASQLRQLLDFASAALALAGTERE